MAETWRRSSYSDASGGVHCVELCWRTSSYTGCGANCVEVAQNRVEILIRDTKQNGQGPILAFSQQAFKDLLNRIKEGRL